MPVRKTSAVNDLTDWEKWNKKISAFSYTDCDSFFPSTEKKCWYCASESMVPCSTLFLPAC